MNTKDFTSATDAIDFIEELANDDNTVDVAKLSNGSHRVTWIKNKKYVTFDGKEFTDEVWTKEDGTMIVCQDLELAHAKNIIRMMLRQNREMLLQSSLADVDCEAYDDDDDEVTEDDIPRVLH